MKVRIEIDRDCEEEVVIKCRQSDERISRIERFVSEQFAPLSLTFYKQDEEFYIPLSDVLFFETDADKVYAHTSNDSFLTKSKLYELELQLPRQFIRASKGTIVNTRQVYSVQKNIASSSLVQFYKSTKQLYVSRLFYKQFKMRLEAERSLQ